MDRREDKDKKGFRCKVETHSHQGHNDEVFSNTNVPNKEQETQRIIDHRRSRPLSWWF